MAKKHFEDYINTIYKQYLDLNEALQELSQEVENNLISPERLDQLKLTIAPIKNSYETLLYVKYLLDMPQRKEKQLKYKNTHKKMVEKCGENTFDKIKDRNKKIIDTLKV